MGGGNRGSFKPIEYGKVTVGVVKLRRWLKKKREIKSLWFIYSFSPSNFPKGLEIGELGCLFSPKVFLQEKEWEQTLGRE